MAIIHVTVFQRMRVAFGRSVFVRLIGFSLAGILVSSVVLYFSEHEVPDTEYESYSHTLVNILVLVLSGFDVAQPQTWPGRVSAFFALMLGICILGSLIGELSAFLVERRLKGGQGMSAVKCSGHTIITRWSKDTEEIIAGLLSEDLKNHRPIVVIDRDADQLPITHPMVHFVKGDPTDSAVLERAGVLRAHTAIILSNPAAGDYNAEDSRNILITLAIESMNREVYTCVQILNPENKKHLERANADEVICTTEISTKMLVQSSINHGLSDVLSKLLSFGEGSEIYRVPLAPRWTGKSYTDLLVDLRREHKATLLALQSGEDVHINPLEEVAVKAGDHAFVLAEDYPEEIAK